MNERRMNLNVSLNLGVTLAVAFALAFGLTGCATPTSEVRSAAAPLSLSGDSADHGCDIVLRGVVRPRQSGGFATVCEPEGRCWFRWEVLVDVSDDALASGGAPGLLYQSGSDPTFWDAELRAAVDGAAPGYQRFLFDMAEHTVSPGMSLTSLMRTRIELIAVFTTPTGRLFDHNHHDADWGNQVLTSDNGWALAADPAVCPSSADEPSATLSFRYDHREFQHGAIVAGGVLRVEYDQARLRDCRSEYMSVPLWSLDAGVRFLPGGQTFTGPVVEASVAQDGRPANPVLDVPFEVQVPDDATSAELWFHNHAEARGRCDAWDSDFGRNYRYPVVSSSPPAVGWAGDWGTSIGRGFCDPQPAADPIVIDSWIMSRATCVDVLADVWIAGLTDQSELHPELVLAEVVYRVDGGAPEQAWLEFVERVGNNYRFRWAAPRARMLHEDWSSYGYSFRFSTNGVDWLTAGAAGGGDRQLLRDF